MKIKDARLNAGLTQQAMSDLLEIPLRTIENWEGGKSKPPTYVEKLIIEKLNNIAKEGFNMKKYELRKEYCEVHAKSATLSAKQLEDAVLTKLGDSYKVLCTFATLGEARAAFEKAKETCSTHFNKQAVNFYSFDIIYIQEIPLDDDGEVDYDEPSDIFDVYIKPYAN